MSKQSEEEEIFHRHHKQEPSCEPSPHLFPSHHPEYEQALAHHDKEFAEFYQEAFPYEVTQLESKYSEKQSLESSTSMAPLTSSFDFYPAGTSGISGRVPFPMSDIETAPTLLSGYPSYPHFIDTSTPTASKYQSPGPPNQYASMPQEHHSPYSTNVVLGQSSTNPQLMSDSVAFPQVQMDPSGKQFLQSSVDETTTLSTPSTAPSTPTSPSSISPSLHRQVSEESPQPYKSVGRPRRGRRRGYRRGSYSTRLLNKPTQGHGDCLETFEKRNIQEEALHAYVQITEQPRPKALRFRYICEGRSAGSIPGVNSTSTRKTFPTIRVVNSKGPAFVVVSCVTVNEPHRPHPHNLVGKEGCEDGVCSVVIDNPMMECSFSNLGIQCVKKRDIESSLARRASKMIDPFHTGFEHRKNLQAIDLNSIRLCFQVYLMDKRTGDRFPLQPIVSEPIYDKKATSDLIIYKISACSSCVSGGKEIILLCDKIVKEDIQVRFFEMKEGQVDWEAYGEFQSSDVHKQVAISFKTPKYRDVEVTQAVKVWLQLYRPSDKSTSETVPFQYYPLNKDYEYVEDKILHISHPASKEPLTSDSPAESMQEGVSPSLSDEGEPTDYSGTGTILKSVKRFKSSPSQGKKGISARFQDLPSEKSQSGSSGFKSRESLFSYSESLSTEHQIAPYEQTYCPQLEGLVEPSFEVKHLPTTATTATLDYVPTTSTASSSSIGTTITPLCPTATLTSSTSEIASAESEVEARHLQYHDMDISDLPSSSEREVIKEESLSPNSESIKKLKQDIETLNKLSNF